MPKAKALWLTMTALAAPALAAPNLKLNDQGYLAEPGLNVMSFSDYYPDGHQTGVTIVQHGVRVAANGDLRLEASPGQWSPMPATGERTVDAATNTVSRHLSYPDPAKDRTGFNPIVYPDLKLGYTVSVTPLSTTRFHRPDLPCWLRFQSSMASSTATGWAMANSGPSASTFNLESVTTVAISRMESRSVSSPVISRSIQIRRSLCALCEVM